MSNLLADADLTSRLGQAGRRRVSELFSMERSVGETERFYERLMETQGVA